jgi:hypothetical protein
MLVGRSDIRAHVPLVACPEMQTEIRRSGRVRDPLSNKIVAVIFVFHLTDPGRELGVKIAGIAWIKVEAG